MATTTQIRTIRAHLAGSHRYETENGTRYLVAPVVVLVEGVVQGATAPAPELALATEFGAVLDQWENRPVTIGHPRYGGHYVAMTTGTPRRDRTDDDARVYLLETEAVGWTRNVRLDGDRLRAEVWIDPDRAAQVGDQARELVAVIEAGDPVEISSGYFCDLEERPGFVGAKPYAGIQRGIVPDHLAILPLGMRGACSWEDGCGIRANAESHAPTQAMQVEARRGLEWRRKHGRGGTPVGVARARDIASGKNLSSETVRRMASFFARQEINKQATGFRRGEEGYPSAGRIAWALWGGDPGQRWAERITQRLNMRDNAMRAQARQQELRLNQAPESCLRTNCQGCDGCGGLVANVRTRARRPSYDGTESSDWSAPSFSDYAGALVESGDPPATVGDASAGLKRRIAAHTLLGDAAADTFRELSFFPVVNPSSGRLNENALRAVISGRGSQADVPDTAKESAQAMARRLLRDEFDADIETNIALSEVEIRDNAISDEDLRTALQIALEERHDGYVYVVAVFPDRVIFRRYVGDDDTAFLQHQYSSDENGNVTIADGEPIRVRPRMEFEALQQPPTGADHDEEDSMKKDEKVAALIASRSTQFGDADRGWLTALSDEQLDKLEPVEVQASEQSGPEPEKPTAEAAPPSAEPSGADVKTHSAPPKSEDEWLSEAPASIRALVERSQREEAERRDSCVSAIRAHSSNRFSEEQLREMDTAILETLRDSLTPEAVRTRPGPRTNGAESYPVPRTLKALQRKDDAAA